MDAAHSSPEHAFIENVDAWAERESIPSGLYLHLMNFAACAHHMREANRMLIEQGDLLFDQMDDIQRKYARLQRTHCTLRRAYRRLQQAQPRPSTSPLPLRSGLRRRTT